MSEPAAAPSGKTGCVNAPESSILGFAVADAAETPATTSAAASAAIAELFMASTIAGRADTGPLPC